MEVIVSALELRCYVDAETGVLCPRVEVTLKSSHFWRIRTNFAQRAWSICFIATDRNGDRLFKRIWATEFGQMRSGPIWRSEPDGQGQGLRSFMAIVWRFMAETPLGRPWRDMDLSDWHQKIYGFHGMHGKLELGGKGCVSPLPPIKPWGVEGGA